MRGKVLFPKTPGYGTARLVYNTRYDGERPDAVVQPLDARDVQAVVRWARRFDVRIVAKGGGHSYAGLLDDRERRRGRPLAHPLDPRQHREQAGDRRRAARS